MRKRTFLSWNHIIILIWWAIFKPYKVMLMKYWEEGGSTDLSAFKKAATSSKKYYRFLQKQDVRLQSRSDRQKNKTK